VLTSYPQVPVVSETSAKVKDNAVSVSRTGTGQRADVPVGPDLLQPLNVITQLGVDLVGNDVEVLALGNVLSPVQEPSGDLELSRVLHDGDDSLEFIRVEFSGSIQRNGKVVNSAVHPPSENHANRLFMSTSAFLQTKLEYRRPTPLISVKAYMIFLLPSTLVLRRRKMCCKTEERQPCPTYILSRPMSLSVLPPRCPPTFADPFHVAFPPFPSPIPCPSQLSFIFPLLFRQRSRSRCTYLERDVSLRRDQRHDGRLLKLF
jgi:hypothetical protein